jgi:ATP-dependent NAD(P)H-hydrate dehydratase
MILGLRTHSGSASSSEDIPVLASVGASFITRTASKIAFGKYGRGVLTSHMISEVGPAFEEIFGKSDEKGFKGSL